MESTPRIEKADIPLNLMYADYPNSENTIFGGLTAAINRKA